VFEHNVFLDVEGIEARRYGRKVFRKNVRIDWIVVWNANIEEEGKGTKLSDKRRRQSDVIEINISRSIDQRHNVKGSSSVASDHTL
jgi:hypothetical protein